MTSFLTIENTIHKDLQTRDMLEELNDNFLLTCLYFSQLAYFSQEHISKKLRETGANQVSIYTKDGTQAFIAEYDDVIFVSFKGREADRWQEVKTDLHFWESQFHDCPVHTGFMNSLEHVKRHLMIDLEYFMPEKRIVYTGHSLGGALALLLALEKEPTDICTFGNPRVFKTKDLGLAEQVNIVRVRTENDFVPSLPPSWLGYTHVGQEVVLEGRGKSWNSHRIRSYLRGVLEDKILDK